MVPTQLLVRVVTPLLRRVAIAAVLSWGSLCSAGEVRVAVATNFSAPMREIATAFEQSGSHQTRLSFGSSGKLYAQIANGAPFELFLSADSAKPRALIEQGLAEADSSFTYAVGTLALWAPGTEDPWALLHSGIYRRLAIANARVAPYGAAAREVLAAEGLLLATQSKLVTGENINQAYQFVATGNAQLGFVALSQLLAGGEMPADAEIIPASLHAPITQDAVLLPGGADNAAAVALLAFLQGPTAREIMRRYGYRHGDL